jgi:hypothetical protein
MSPKARSPNLKGKARFRALIDALSRETDIDVDLSGGAFVLRDELQSVRLVVELSSDEDSVYALHRFLPIPADEAHANALAAKLLAINADRTALDGASIGTDVRSGNYCLFRELGLSLEPALFVAGIQDLMELGELVRAAVLGEDPYDDSARNEAIELFTRLRK